MNPAYVASSLGSVYANPAVTKSFIRGIVLHNTNTIVESVSIHMVPNSSGALGTADNSNRIFYVPVQPGETKLLEIPYCITLTGTNDAIFAVTPTASKVVIVINGDQES